MESMSVCAIPGANLNIPKGAFPDPEWDIDGSGPQQAILGGGCFWCTEAVYRQLAGVTDVIAGYAGGTESTADYRTVCSGSTDHAEVIRVDFDADSISFGQILKVFFSVAHDPTQKDRQGNDIGRQYRSCIFSLSEDQAEVARRYMAQLEAAGVFRGPIMTTLEQGPFYRAEDYHQDYAALNPNQGYIRAVALPKVEKTRKVFADRLR